ncbi:Zinc finger B-box domain-containing protein 1 [Geodia barretti]|uniref:Zinc finger B-box domain-containing protein 1 n=1 Tax=Geodia barretti TaxID=519541 RepID=A0AA35VVH0_GEOBA|nr:Zinc finger B-box domain-containing protein 1 [Geodia barretti]
MEERLQVLKKMMSIEKASRESTPGTHFWGSSNTPSRSHSGSETGDQEPGHGTGTKRQQLPPRVKFLTEEVVGGREGLKWRRCGQCEKPSAKVVCIECGENYCLACFARFHQKGALSRHRVKPIKQMKGKVREVNVGKTSCGTSTTEPSGVSSERGTENAEGERHEGGKGKKERKERDDVREAESWKSLWEGEYDEQASAQSFQEALAEWRATCAEPVVVAQATSCSTQTTVGVTQPTTTVPADPEKEVSFGKHSGGGVSYFEKMVLRRLHTNPHSLLSSHPNTHQKQLQMAGTIIDSEEEETVGESVCPSQYNLFHTHGSNEPGQTQNSLLIPRVSDSTDIPRPASSVKIEEVTFVDGHSSSRAADEEVPDAQSTVKKDVSSTLRHPREREEKGKRRPLQKQYRARKRQKASDPTSTNHRLNKRKGGSSSIQQTFSQTVGRIFEHHTKPGSSIRPHSDGKLTDFFLSGVEESDTPREKRTGDEEGESSVSGPSLLPISATVWLPDNSLAPDRDEPGNTTCVGPLTTCVDPLDHSVYCIETDLPPPSNTATRISSSVDPFGETPESESETDGEEFGDDSSDSEEHTSEDYGKDSETLEDLAWELQSLTSGRGTRCELGDGVEDVGEWEKGRDELEAEMERAKTSFEIYQQELMQQDSD